MRTPITRRPLTAEEQQAVQAGRRSPPRVTVRRGPGLLASQRGQQAGHSADHRYWGEPNC